MYVFLHYTHHAHLFEYSNKITALRVPTSPTANRHRLNCQQREKYREMSDQETETERETGTGTGTETVGQRQRMGQATCSSLSSLNCIRSEDRSFVPDGLFPAEFVVMFAFGDEVASNTSCTGMPAACDCGMGLLVMTIAPSETDDE